MDARKIFQSLEASDEYERNASGGEIVLTYNGVNNKGERVKEWVRRTDIDYIKDGEVHFNVYHVIERDGKFEDIVVHDKKNNVHYQNLYYEND